MDMREAFALIPTDAERHAKLVSDIKGLHNVKNTVSGVMGTTVAPGLLGVRRGLKGQDITTSDRVVSSITGGLAGGVAGAMRAQVGHYDTGKVFLRHAGLRSVPLGAALGAGVSLLSNKLSHLAAAKYHELNTPAPKESSIWKFLSKSPNSPRK